MRKRFFSPAVLTCLLTLIVLAQPPLFAAEVVVYTSVDQIFSQPVLQDFEKETGITVKPLYDVEAAKTVGLVNRLIAEKDRPRADVFWNSEVSRTIRLEEEGVLQPYQSPYWAEIPAEFKSDRYLWTGLGARARVLIYNKNMLAQHELPTSFFELTQPRWKGKVAIAYPLFGTTAMHVAALYSLIGADLTEYYLESLVKNGVVVVDGNSVTRDMVVEGQLPLGFTDTDDANVAIGKGAPVDIIYPDKKGLGTLFIPNTVMMIEGAPHPETAKRLIDYLLSPENEKRLIEDGFVQLSLRGKSEGFGEMPDAKAMPVDYRYLAEFVEPSADFCKELFSQ